MRYPSETVQTFINLRAIEADLIRLAARIKACEAELQRRPLAAMTTTELLRVLALSRREYFRRRNPLLKPLDSYGVPASAGETIDQSNTCENNPSTPSANPEKPGNISGTPAIPVAPEALRTTENPISDFRNPCPSVESVAELSNFFKNHHCNHAPLA